jgi:hypothetical protein
MRQRTSFPQVAAYRAWASRFSRHLSHSESCEWPLAGRRHGMLTGFPAELPAINRLRLRLTRSRRMRPAAIGLLRMYSVRRWGVVITVLPYWRCRDCRMKGAGCPAPLRSRDRHQRSACADFDVSTTMAARDMGTAKFEPENPDRMAKFTPITFPLALNTGPPEPPEVVCAS